MEDYLLSVSCSLADTHSGEIFYNSIFHKPLSVLSDEDILKYFHSFQRGLRQGKDVALYMLVAKDRDIPKQAQEQKNF